MNLVIPPVPVLSERKKKIGERNRYCSQAVFFHDDQTRHKWLSYFHNIAKHNIQSRKVI